MRSRRPPDLHFEGASFRRSTGPGNPAGYNHQITPTGITMRAVSMGYCVRLAYGLTVLRPYELVAPDWFDPHRVIFRYDIVARTSMPVAAGQILEMLQALLQERVKLAVFTSVSMEELTLQLT